MKRQEIGSETTKITEEKELLSLLKEIIPTKITNNIKVLGNNLTSVKVLEPEKVEETFNDFFKKLQFPKSVLDYIENNKWIKIPNKNLYFNREIMACYPNFLSDKYPILHYSSLENEVTTVERALKIIKAYDEYTKYGIDWDIQTQNEGKNSFFKITHPMEVDHVYEVPKTTGFSALAANIAKANSNSNYKWPTEKLKHPKEIYHGIQNSIEFCYKETDGKISGYSNYDFSPSDSGLLIPIFRLGRKEDHDEFNITETPFDYSPEITTLLLFLNYLIPDFSDNEINDEYRNFYRYLKKCRKYFTDFKLDENREIAFSLDLNKVGEEIIAGDSENLFGERRLLLNLENGESLEISFSAGKVVGTGVYKYKNGDTEVCSYDWDDNGNLFKTGKSIITKSNKDVEKLSYIDGVPQGETEYSFSNGDKEIRNYKDGVFQGKSEYRFANGDKEIRKYTDGKLIGDAVLYLSGGRETKRYRYEENKKRDMTSVYRLLTGDKVRVNLDPYNENILTDPNRGHWEVTEENAGEIEAALGKKVYRRDPHLDIKEGGIVGIDFGTKSTVVVFQDDNNKTLPMRISGGIMEADVKESDYENPTVIEFKDLTSFIVDYREKEGRPFTKWEDVTVSHTAFQNLVTGASEEFYSTIPDLKQWAGVKNEKITVRDKKGMESIFPPYMELEEGDIDPIEIYAYYIGSYINNMRNGIYLEYFLSFPVTYEKEIREKILQSFERGIKKSLPEEILKDEEVMKKFQVKYGANEPAAYAVCALQEYEIEPEEDETIYYGVFDFGGGTLDFDFGTWKFSDDELRYDYELEHFGAGGDRNLGGENILKELAYEVFKDNKINIEKYGIVFARPAWCERFPGDEKIVDNSQEAKLNLSTLGEKLRPIWENSEDGETVGASIKALLYNKKGELFTGVELQIDEDKLKKIIEDKIERGIENFLIVMKKAMEDEPVKHIIVFLAGNSCRHPKVMELFEKHKNDIGIDIEVLPALGTKKCYEILKEREIEVDENDVTRPTGKTGVAYGILDSIAEGRIKVTNRSEKENINDEIQFKYYVGDERRKKFSVVLSPNIGYETYMILGYCKSDKFNLFYTTMPEAITGKMSIDRVERIRHSLKNNYENQEAKIYIKAVGPKKIAYCVTVDAIENKNYLEEGEIELD